MAWASIKEVRVGPLSKTYLQYRAEHIDEIRALKADLEAAVAAAQAPPVAADAAAAAEGDDDNDDDDDEEDIDDVDAILENINDELNAVADDDDGAD